VLQNCITKSQLRHVYSRWYATATVAISNKLYHPNNAYPRHCCLCITSTITQPTHPAPPPPSTHAASSPSAASTATTSTTWRVVPRMQRGERSFIFESPLSSVQKVEPLLRCPLEKRNVMNSGPPSPCRHFFYVCNPLLGQP
jgi:hypothetical protein